MFLSPETTDEATAVPLYAFAKLYNASESEANDCKYATAFASVLYWPLKYVAKNAFASVVHV